MITENLSTLKIHKLTQAQYNRELAAGNIDETALYLTPDEEYYTKSEIDNMEFITIDAIDNICQQAIVPTSVVYAVGTPVEFTLSVDGWNGTTYELKAENYSIGSNDVQIGLPTESSTVNTQAVVAAALTIVHTLETAANTSNGTPAYVTLTISAIETPIRDITIAIFGLEAA